MLEPHDALTVTATSMVDVRDRRAILPLVGDLQWEQARDLLHRDTALETLDARQFVLDVAGGVPVARGDRVRPAVVRPRSPAASRRSSELCVRLHDEFEFAPGATTVSTPIDEVLARRAGVCQDFAHLTISALRGLGLAARYVSGYLETDPPPGREPAWSGPTCPTRGCRCSCPRSAGSTSTRPTASS